MAVKTFTDLTTLPASDINTYLANAGLVYVKQQTVGTAVSSVEVTGAFSADYDNYYVTYTGGTGGGVNLRVQIGNATTGYYYQLMYIQYSTSGAPLTNVADNNGARFTYVGTANTTTILEMRLFAPFLTQPTRIISAYIDSGLSGHGAGLLNNNNSYTSFTITPQSGTLTGGTVRVYGYRIG